MTEESINNTVPHWRQLEIDDHDRPSSQGEGRCSVYLSLSAAVQACKSASIEP